ncbi:curli assembly protein CsgF [Noviherbaspirillum sp.]|uniref:curli assembly protein CsgF n=1 Tax=Noviherbaspirillum sp. TaxID=1926288 RepID=UPI002D2A24FE|nr:curli assembly protein CsgF [Noviherbaspirillum sp.]HZW20248.1 curli assembly protein CsgF [Noviherbaspirillum sp.]
MYSKNCIALAACGWLPVAALLAGSAGATELVYNHVNPSFGGSPLNGSVLMGTAQAQNKTKDPDDLSSRLREKTALQQFNESLQRSVLSQLASAAMSGIMSNGKLIPGIVQAGDFKIAIADMGNGMLQITTTDTITGASTTFQVSQ